MHRQSNQQLLKVVAFLGEGLSHGNVNVLLVLCHQRRVHSHNRRGKSRRLNQLQVRIAREHASQPDKRLLKVVVALGRNIIILQVLLAMESNLTGLDLALLHIDLVTTEDDGDVLADADEVTMPVGDILVGDAAGDVEHDDAALALDVVDVAEAAKLFLAGSVPDIKDDRATVRVEEQRANLNTNSG